MDKRRSILNVSVSVGSKIITVLLAIITKRLLITYCGNEVNGLNALYISIIGFLAVAELGVGTAISFSMYRPIVEGDHQKVSALYHLFRRLYLLISGVIFIGGLLISPFLHIFAKDYQQINVNLYFTFLLMLISVVGSYWFGAETALINAYKNNYITTAITSGCLILQNILQILCLTATGSFVWYLGCRSIATAAQWILTKLFARKHYSGIMRSKHKIGKETEKELLRSIKAMFMHKIGTLLVQTADSIIISMFIGVVTLGAYSNYTMVLDSMTGILILFFSSLTSVLGHLYAEKSKKETSLYCEAFHLMNFWIGTVFYLGYYAVINNLIAILFSEELIISKAIVIVITLNGFIQFMRQNAIVFRDATGTFYYDRWKPLLEGIVNIVLSVALVKKIGVAGVIAATVITNLLICHLIEPYVLYKKAFELSPRKYYLKNYGMIVIFGVSLILMDQCLLDYESHWKALFVNGCISVAISAAVSIGALFIHKDTFPFIIKKMKN